MALLSPKPPLVIDHHQPARQAIRPSPRHEIEIGLRRSPREAADEKSGEAGSKEIGGEADRPLPFDGAFEDVCVTFGYMALTCRWRGRTVAERHRIASQDG